MIAVLLCAGFATRMYPISDHCDAPGYFIDYLCQRETVYAFKLDASRFDVGNINSYREADERLGKEPIFKKDDIKP